MFALSHRVKRGMIMIWSGARTAVPLGWTLCNGLLGAPDLQAKFIPGACDACPEGTEGGATNHVHTIACNSHQHLDDVGNPECAAGDDFSVVGLEVVVTGQAASQPHLPPYYSLAYIMKL